MAKTNNKDKASSQLKKITVTITVLTVLMIVFSNGFYSTKSSSEKPGYDFDAIYFYDILFKLRKNLEHQGEEAEILLHVDIDDETLEKMQTRWPLTRKEQADGFQALLDLGAKQAVFDIEYIDPAPLTINRNRIADLISSTKNSFKETLKIAKSKEPGFIKKRMISDEGKKLLFAIDDLAPDSDKPLAEVLQGLSATIGVHSTLDPSQLDFMKDGKKKYQAWFEKLEKKELALNTKVPDANRFGLHLMDEEVEASLGVLKWEAFKVQLIKKYKSLQRLEMENLLEYTEWRYKEHLAQKWTEKNNSKAIQNTEPSGKKLKIKPPHYTLVQHWGDDTVNCGVVNAQSDPDGVVRRVPLYQDLNGRRYFNLAFRAYLKLKNIPVQSLVFHQDKIVAGSISIPVEESRWLRLNWYDRTERRKEEKISFGQLYILKELELDARKAMEYALQMADLRNLIKESRKIPAENLISFMRKHRLTLKDDLAKKTAESLEADEFFGLATKKVESYNKLFSILEPKVKGKFAIVGVAATSSTDRRATPIRVDVDMVDLQATIADNMLRERYAKPLSVIIQALIALLILSFLARGLLLYDFKGGLVFYFTTGLIVLTVSYVLFLSGGYLIRGATLFVGCSLMFITVTGVKQLNDSQEKFFFKAKLRQYLSANVADQIAKNPDLIQEMDDGKSVNITVLFSDIVGFTTFCESKSPEEVKLYVNKIMDVLTPCIFEFDGTFDKYMGDCIMAFFGAPLSLEDHAEKAVLCAKRMTELMKKLSKEFEEQGMTPLTIGTGISSGYMNVANFGSSDQKDYSVIGDTVNLGARIEALTRGLESDILISEQTFEGIKDKNIKCEYRGEHEVKGKALPVKIWKVLT